ncbi:gamma-interferon-responsive lysosomal thiol protein isoform X1 [Elaeis guineensis]|uniref:Gamma-interferon-responsive lysosomal thiol protein isoform X1 n=1 Tax=Elaeis guineensis var. tenera TaxID=51953 RepID=A0A6I9SE41_ELAGV|nr:gamma-interferon-responsive lysosomal thiol protein isoform X1 [Elaeis guineensis]
MASGRLLLVFFLISSSCFASSPVSARKVPLALYYETLCPYCSNFIVNYLAKIFENGLIDIIELDLIPYGNARIGSNDTISCQHGPNECVLNTVEACAITAWPDVSEHFSFIYCVESLVMEHKYLEWESCFSKTGLDSNAVLDCYKSGYGKKLELHYAAQTDSLQPPHTYVPWVVVDGQPLYDDYRNFEAYICKAYDGKLPKSCAGLSLKLSSERKTDNQACYADERTDPSITTENDEMKIEMIIKTSTVTFYKS